MFCCCLNGGCFLSIPPVLLNRCPKFTLRDLQDVAQEAKTIEASSSVPLLLRKIVKLLCWTQPRYGPRLNAFGIKFSLRRVSDCCAGSSLLAMWKWHRTEEEIRKTDFGNIWDRIEERRTDDDAKEHVAKGMVTDCNFGPFLISLSRLHPSAYYCWFLLLQAASISGQPRRGLNSQCPNKQCAGFTLGISTWFPSRLFVALRITFITPQESVIVPVLLHPILSVPGRRRGRRLASLPTVLLVAGRVKNQDQGD